jgi:Fe-S-cluster formation regulator IscX/YfhJ
VPKGLDETYYGNASKKANEKVLYAIFRHWIYTLESLQDNHGKTNVCGIESIEIRPWILQVISYSYAELRIR